MARRSMVARRRCRHLDASLSETAAQASQPVIRRRKIADHHRAWHSLLPGKYCDSHMHDYASRCISLRECMAGEPTVPARVYESNQADSSTDDAVGPL